MKLLIPTDFTIGTIGVVLIYVIVAIVLIAMIFNFFKLCNDVCALRQKYVPVYLGDKKPSKAKGLIYGDLTPLELLCQMKEHFERFPLNSIEVDSTYHAKIKEVVEKNEKRERV